MNHASTRQTGSEEEKREREFHKQEERMVDQTYLAGTFTLSGTSLTLNRMGVIADLDAIGRALGH